MLSVLRYCWLGAKKSIWPVKIEWWGVVVVMCLERGADCLHVVQLMPLHPRTPESLASFKSRLVLPFCYWLTQVVLGKRPWNGCSSSGGGDLCQQRPTGWAWTTWCFLPVHLSVRVCVPAELFLDWLAVEFLQIYFSRIIIQYCIVFGGSVAEWLACWTLAQYGLGSNRSRDAVG